MSEEIEEAMICKLLDHKFALYVEPYGWLGCDTCWRCGVRNGS